MLTPLDSLTLERDFLLHVLELAHHDDPKLLLDEALQIVVRVSGARHGYIALEAHDSASATSFSATTTDFDPQHVRSVLSSTIMRVAFTEGRTVHTRAAFEDARFAEASSVREQRIDAVVCVPIGLAPLEGVVYLQGTPDGKPFSPHVVRLCELFARHLATIAPRLLRRAAQGVADPTARWRDKLGGADKLVGTSYALADSLKEAAGVVGRDIGVLITGGSGTGKTALAKLIHDNGSRAKAPFIELNCATIPAGLAESELFGAMPGAHSTAKTKSVGKIAAADKGTLFLDEIGELDLMVQAKLLQFLQDKTFYMLGQARSQRADVRVIAATNANLRERVKQGTFRDDLFYRLCIVEIPMPPLTDRRVDIVPLAERFLSSVTSRDATPKMAFSERALRSLESRTGQATCVS